MCTLQDFVTLLQKTLLEKSKTNLDRSLAVGLASASGRLPTPRGGVNVDWLFDGDGLLSMVVEAPPGLSGNVFPPYPLRIAETRISSRPTVSNTRVRSGLRSRPQAALSGGVLASLSCQATRDKGARFRCGGEVVAMPDRFNWRA